MATPNDDAGGMLARARSGEEAGFLELWRQLQPRLLRYLRILNCEDADDVASETWLQVVRDLPRFNGGDDEFRRWLFAVARNRALDAARARRRQRTVPMTISVDALVDEDMVEDQVLHALSVERAVRLLAELPADRAEVVALRVLAGLDTNAVADILGKSPGVVRVALHRGLRSLAANPAVQELAPVPVGQPARAAPSRTAERRRAASAPAWAGAAASPATRLSDEDSACLAEQVDL
jgi:RNA polymerase sigma-70 factor (ECF subfamily)